FVETGKQGETHSFRLRANSAPRIGVRMKKKKKAPAGLRPHPDSDRIAKGVGRCLPLVVSWSGELFRATSQDYANQRDVGTGEGSRKAGGRFNGKGSYAALYNALGMAAATSESAACSRQQGIIDPGRLR